MYTFLEGSQTSTSEGEKKKVVAIAVSTESDIPVPENDWGCGSMCIIADYHSVKILNENGEWK